MKTFIVSSIAIIAVGLGLVTSASAECVSGCTITVPAPTVTTFMAGGTAQFSGFGGAVFTGNKEGYALVEKVGAAGVDVKMNAAGKLCGVDCNSGNFSYAGYANEAVKASAGALSNQSGLAATATNQGNAMANVTLQAQKVLK